VAGAGAWVPALPAGATTIPVRRRLTLASQSPEVLGPDAFPGDRRRFPAVLAASDTPDTWRMWSYAWNAGPGTHTVTVRCTDGTGTLQTRVVQDVIPNGAGGYHAITVTAG
jgi:hypothetical protein